MTALWIRIFRLLERGLFTHGLRHGSYVNDLIVRVAWYLAVKKKYNISSEMDTLLKPRMPRQMGVTSAR